MSVNVVLTKMQAAAVNDIAYARGTVAVSNEDRKAIVKPTQSSVVYEIGAGGAVKRTA